MSSSKPKKISMEISLEWKDFFIIAQIVLLTLKLCGVIQWSWWLVLTPTLIPIVGVSLAFIVLLACALFSPKFREFIHDAAEATRDEDKEHYKLVGGQKEVEIEINGADNEDNNTNR